MGGKMIKGKVRKSIVADRACGMSIRALAQKYSVSTTSVQRILREDPELTQLVTKKKKEETQDILEYMEGQKDKVCEIIGAYLNVLSDLDNFDKLSPNQLTTALGTLIDKWTVISGSVGDSREEDALSRSLREMAEELESDV